MANTDDGLKRAYALLRIATITHKQSIEIKNKEFEEEEHHSIIICYLAGTLLLQTSKAARL